MKIYAGFDSGGSTTRCLLSDEKGNALGMGKSGPSNFLFCGKEMAAHHIQECLQLALKQAKDRGLLPNPAADYQDGSFSLEGIFVASAAVEVFDGKTHADFFQEVTGCQNTGCDSDILPVWYAGTRPRFSPAICSIAGTGAITYLLSGNRFVKSSGWGPLFGDEGAGYDIGRKALQLASRMSDLREPMDPVFYQAVLDFYHVSAAHPRRLLRAVMQVADDGIGTDTRSRVAAVTRCVDQLAEEGNESAGKLFAQAAEDASASVRAVIARSAQEDPYDWTPRDSGEMFTLVLSGGLFREKSPLYRALCRTLSRESRLTGITIPKVSAVQSAASIALYQNGRSEAAEHLMEQIYES